MTRHLLFKTIVCSLTLIILTIYYLITLPPIDTWTSFLIIWLGIFLLVVFFTLLFSYLAKNSTAKSNVKQCINFLTATPVGIVLGLSFLSACIISVAILTGFEGDYTAYIQQWSVILEGDDPWNPETKIPRNAYGPLFNALALIYAIHPLAPKLLLCIAWLSASIWLIRILRKYYKEESLTMLGGLIFLLINPFFLGTIARDGIFDILPAICILGAVALRTKRYFFLSGLVLGIGILFKYYPIIMLPFLMIDRPKLKLLPLLSCMGVIISGFMMSFLIWGMSTFSPIFFARGRQSKILSIFRFFRGKFSPLHFLTDPPNLDRYSTYAMLLFILLILILTWFKNIETSLAGIVGMLTAFTFYKVGHFQFYTCLFLMVPFWYATSILPERRKRRILLSNGILLIWIASLQLAYHLSISNDRIYGFNDKPWIYLRDIIGLPTFLLSCWAIITAIYYGYLITSQSSLQISDE